MMTNHRRGCQVREIVLLGEDKGEPGNQLSGRQRDPQGFDLSMIASTFLVTPHPGIQAFHTYVFQRSPQLHLVHSNEVVHKHIRNPYQKKCQTPHGLDTGTATVTGTSSARKKHLPNPVRTQGLPSKEKGNHCSINWDFPISFSWWFFPLNFSLSSWVRILPRTLSPSPSLSLSLSCQHLFTS